LTGCKKKEEVPVITTIEVSSVTATTATSGGSISNEGSSTVISRGVCWSTGTTPTISDNKTTDAAGAGSFVSNITGLSGATTYYIRAYATNSAGIGYGMALSFTTFGQAPSPTNASATNVTATGATLNGSVNANYLSTVVTFEYGTTASYGSNITATQSPIIGNSVTNVSVDISGLTAGTAYHFRIKAVNSLGTSYSNDLTFTTLGLPPTVTTVVATEITSTGATLNGIVNANYLSSVVTFEYGTTASYGSTATATQSPVTGSTNTNVRTSLTGLISGTIYHFRVKAVNSLGTSYGSDEILTTILSDFDGNIYNAVTIGNQVWMKENLKTTKYRNGDLIGTTTSDMRSESMPKYQWAYDGIESNVATYGRLYTWYAVTDTRNVCPIGWHVPTDAEWTILTDYLTANGYGFEGSGSDIAKSMAATSGWALSTVVGTSGYGQASNNSSGFTALPTGMRDLSAEFSSFDKITTWWSSSEYDSTFAYGRYMTYGFSDVFREHPYKAYGNPVRCLRQ
jgi:uncharacterized protein (TIGR02145 family)